MYYEVQGTPTKPMAVLCDGLGCDGFAWKYLKPALAQSRQVLHWNYRGHGYSAAPDDLSKISMDAIFSDLNAILEKEKVEKSVVFGHSMGVQVALEFQRRFPERVSGLVLLCGSYGHPLDTWHDHTLLRRAFPFIEKLAHDHSMVLSTMLRLLLPTKLSMWFAIKQELNEELLNPKDFEPYLEHLSRMNPVHFVQTLKSLQEHTAWDHLPNITIPTLVVAGEIDRFAPAWLSQRMADRIPNAELLMVSGGSHTAPLERPELVNEAVTNFWKKNFVTV